MQIFRTRVCLWVAFYQKIDKNKKFLEFDEILDKLISFLKCVIEEIKNYKKHKKQVFFENGYEIFLNFFFKMFLARLSRSETKKI